MFDVISMCLLFFILWLFEMASFHYCTLFPVTTQEKRTKRMWRLGWVTNDGHAESERQAEKPGAKTLTFIQVLLRMGLRSFSGEGLLDHNARNWSCQLGGRAGSVRGHEGMLGGGGFLIRSQEEWEEDTAFSLHTKVTDRSFSPSSVFWEGFISLFHILPFQFSSLLPALAFICYCSFISTSSPPALYSPQVVVCAFHSVDIL